MRIICFFVGVSLLTIALPSYSQQESVAKKMSPTGLAIQDTLCIQKINALKYSLDTTLSKLSLPSNELDSIQLKHVSRLLSELDSLQQSLPDQKRLVAQVDSIRQAALVKIKEKLFLKNRIDLQVNDQEKNFLKKYDLPIDKLNATDKLDGLTIPELPNSNNGNKLSALQDNVNVRGADDLKDKLPSVPSLQDLVPYQLKNVLNQVSTVTEKVGAVGEELNELKQKGQEYRENVDKLAEESLKNLKDVKGFENQLNTAEKLKQVQQLELEKIKNAQSLRDQLASTKVAEKVLASEEQVKEHMEKMSKHKKKFDQLNDIRYVPKLKPNAMKGRSFKERIAPGMLFQIVKSDKVVSWYMAPELLYKFSGTFSGGVAGVYRFQYAVTPKIVRDNPLYGYKVTGQAKAWKSFYLRTEFERLNYLRPIRPNLDPIGRQWDTNWLVGVGRPQRISNRLSGQVWAFYNVKRDHSDIFSNKIIVKSGIQFNLVNDFKKVASYVERKLKKEEH